MPKFRSLMHHKWLDPADAVHQDLQGVETWNQRPNWGSLIQFFCQGIEQSVRMPGTWWLEEMLWDIKGTFGNLKSEENGFHFHPSIENYVWLVFVQGGKNFVLAVFPPNFFLALWKSRFDTSFGARYSLVRATKALLWKWPNASYMWQNCLVDETNISSSDDLLDCCGRCYRWVGFT